MCQRAQEGHIQLLDFHASNKKVHSLLNVMLCVPQVRPAKFKMCSQAAFRMSYLQGMRGQSCSPDSRRNLKVPRGATTSGIGPNRIRELHHAGATACSRYACTNGRSHPECGRTAFSRHVTTNETQPPYRKRTSLLNLVQNHVKGRPVQLERYSRTKKNLLEVAEGDPIFSARRIPNSERPWLLCKCATARERPAWRGRRQTLLS